MCQRCREPLHYTAASNQQRDVRLRKSQLFDLTVDAAESYDLANKHPDVVRDLEARIAQALSTFPEEIRHANADFLTSSRSRLGRLSEEEQMTAVIEQHQSLPGFRRLFGIESRISWLRDRKKAGEICFTPT